ncbi:hypothetical protein DFH09DRAFT_1076673 [Mycena vulgaris]|nr:hypothetical protein DFH09DRAFT_1076673 [Mycena vulgaris]
MATCRPQLHRGIAAFAIYFPSFLLRPCIDSLSMPEFLFDRERLGQASPCQRLRQWPKSLYKSSAFDVTLPRFTFFVVACVPSVARFTEGAHRTTSAHRPSWWPSTISFVAGQLRGRALRHTTLSDARTIRDTRRTCRFVAFPFHTAVRAEILTAFSHPQPPRPFSPSSHPIAASTPLCVTTPPPASPVLHASSPHPSFSVPARDTQAPPPNPPQSSFVPVSSSPSSRPRPHPPPHPPSAASPLAYRVSSALLFPAFPCPRFSPIYPLLPRPLITPTDNERAPPSWRTAAAGMSRVLVCAERRRMQRGHRGRALRDALVAWRMARVRTARRRARGPGCSADGGEVAGVASLGVHPACVAAGEFVGEGVLAVMVEARRERGYGACLAVDAHVRVEARALGTRGAVVVKLRNGAVEMQRARCDERAARECGCGSGCGGGCCAARSACEARGALGSGCSAPSRGRGRVFSAPSRGGGGGNVEARRRCGGGGEGGGVVVRCARARGGNGEQRRPSLVVQHAQGLHRTSVDVGVKRDGAGGARVLRSCEGMWACTRRCGAGRGVVEALTCAPVRSALEAQSTQARVGAAPKTAPLALLVVREVVEARRFVPFRLASQVTCLLWPSNLEIGNTINLTFPIESLCHELCLFLLYSAISNVQILGSGGMTMNRLQGGFSQRSIGNLFDYNSVIVLVFGLGMAEVVHVDREPTRKLSAESESSFEGHWHLAKLGDKFRVVGGWKHQIRHRDLAPKRSDLRSDNANPVVEKRWISSPWVFEAWHAPL